MSSSNESNDIAGDQHNPPDPVRSPINVQSRVISVMVLDPGAPDGQHLQSTTYFHSDDQNDTNGDESDSSWQSDGEDTTEAAPPESSEEPSASGGPPEVIDDNLGRFDGLPASLEDMIKCSICLSPYDDPRSLPCLHSFCCICLQNCHIKAAIAIKWERRVTNLPCPICRTEFKIPQKGMDGLPKNFFINQLSEVCMMKRADVNNLQCELCLGGDKMLLSIEAMSSATIFCLECDKKMCDSCHESHKKNSFLRDHHLEKIEGPESIDKIKTKFDEVWCEKHEIEKATLYCFSCGDAICLTCLDECHSGHECVSLSKAAQMIRSQMMDQVEVVTQFSDNTSVQMAAIREQKRVVSKKLNGIRTSIKKRANRLRKIIDEHEKDLLEELKHNRWTVMEDLKIKENSLVLNYDFEDEFVKRVRSLAENSTDVGICRNKTALDHQFSELEVYHVPRDVFSSDKCMDVQAPGFIFEAEEYEYTANLIGRINYSANSAEDDDDALENLSTRSQDVTFRTTSEPVKPGTREKACQTESSNSSDSISLLDPAPRFSTNGCCSRRIPNPQMDERIQMLLNIRQPSNSASTSTE